MQSLTNDARRPSVPQRTVAQQNSKQTQSAIGRQPQPAPPAYRPQTASSPQVAQRSIRNAAPPVYRPHASSPEPVAPAKGTAPAAYRPYDSGAQRKGVPHAAAPPVYSPQIRPALQCKRPWQQQLEQANAKFQDLQHLYQTSTQEYVTVGTQLLQDGQQEDQNNPEPLPANENQRRLNHRAVALYEWVKEVNSTSGGKLYEMVTHKYHREQRSRYVWPGISNTDDPDLYVYAPKSGSQTAYHRRAEEVKMVSVSDPGEVKSQAESAARQLEKSRASTDYYGQPIDTMENSRSAP